MATIVDSKEANCYLPQGASMLLDVGFVLWFCFVMTDRVYTAYLLVFQLLLWIWLGWVLTALLSCSMLPSLVTMAYTSGCMVVFTCFLIPSQ